MNLIWLLWIIFAVMLVCLLYTAVRAGHAVLSMHYAGGHMLGAPYSGSYSGDHAYLTMAMQFHAAGQAIRVGITIMPALWFSLVAAAGHSSQICASARSRDHSVRTGHVEMLAVAPQPETRRRLRRNEAVPHPGYAHRRPGRGFGSA